MFACSDWFILLDSAPAADENLSTQWGFEKPTERITECEGKTESVGVTGWEIRLRWKGCILNSGNSLSLMIMNENIRE